MDELKVCRECKELKLRTAFPRNRTRKDGLAYECKSCRKSYWDANGHGISKRYRESTAGRLKTLLRSASQRAIEHDLVFDLDYEWLLNLYQKQGGCCSLTGLEFCFETNGDMCQKPFSPSLDRIIPKYGYTKENTRLVCTAINVAFNQHGEEVFRRIAAAYLAKSI